MATFCDMAYTWDANKNKTSESITGGMSGYGFTSAGTTYNDEDLCFSSSLPPPASSLLNDIDANGTADVNFQYEALGRRVTRTGTGGSVVYVQMDQQTIADYPVGGAATTPTFRYVYASYIDEPVVRKTAGTGGTLVYFHRNQQYSITAVTTSTGSIAERYAYSAYGHPTMLDASGTVLQTSNFSLRTSYTGREWDATLGLHHFRARWMSPSAGRFLGRDPIGYEDGMSLYRSQLGLRFLDPNGLQCIEGWRGEACFNFTKFKVKGTLFGDVTPPFLGSWKDKWWIMQSGYFKGTLDASIDVKDVFHCCGCDNEADIPVAIRVNMHIDIDYIELNTRLGYIWTVTRSLFFPYWFNALFYTGPFIKDAREAINKALERLDGFEKGAKMGSNNICDAWRKNGESLPGINLVINLSYANYTYGTPPSSNTREGLFPTVDIDLGSGIPSDCLNKKSFEPGYNPSFGGS